MNAEGKWGDLRTRVISGVILLILCIFALFQGGAIFFALVAIAVALMIWELFQMLSDGNTKLSYSIAVAAFVVICAHLIWGTSVPTFLLAVLPAIFGAVLLPKDKWVFAIYAVSLMFAALGLLYLREAAGVRAVLWLAAIVVVTDVAGYFAGKAIGGPKFWPSVSPKKTWSGTSAGWIAAAVVGLLFGGPSIAIVSVVISFASQLGDLAESAIKRRCNIKDSSQLIPGHGGLLDRFDGLMAAALALLAISIVFGLPI